jgi:prepilin-type N-terminal cleavage/methylation domain-containing protein
MNIYGVWVDIFADLYQFKKMKHSPKTYKGFTLIELLTTLAIMAIMAALLFPFVTNYTKQTSTTSNYQSLKVMQDAIDRYLALMENTNMPPTNWGNYSNVNGTANRYDLSASEVQQVITDITTAGDTETLNMPSPPITSANVRIFIDSNVTTVPAWIVYRYRIQATGDGVNRSGQLVPSASFMGTDSQAQLNAE